MLGKKKSHPQSSADRLQSPVPAVACSIAFWMHSFVNCGLVFLSGFAVDTGARHGCQFSKYCWWLSEGCITGLKHVALCLLDPVFRLQGLPAQAIFSGLAGDAKSAGLRREGVAPAGAVLDTIEIPQVHWTALLAVMQDVALLAFLLN